MKKTSQIEKANAKLTEKAVEQINLTQAQQIEHYRNQRKTIKINWIVTGLLLGAFLGWCGAWLMIAYING